MTLKEPPLSDYEWALTAQKEKLLLQVRHKRDVYGIFMDTVSLLQRVNHVRYTAHPFYLVRARQ